MEFSRQEYWSGLSFPPPGELLNPRIEPSFPTLQANSLLSELPGKPLEPLDHKGSPWFGSSYLYLFLPGEQKLCYLQLALEQHRAGVQPSTQSKVQVGATYSQPSSIYFVPRFTQSQMV